MKTGGRQALELVLVFSALVISMNLIRYLAEEHAMLMSALVFINLPLLLLVMLKRDVFCDLGLQFEGLTAKPFLQFIAFVIVGIFFVFVAIYYSCRPSVPESWLLLSVSNIILVAFPEEVFYRGYMQGMLKRMTDSGLIAVITVSVLFALGHFLVGFEPARLLVFFPALLFSVLRNLTGSIYMPVLLHASSNVAMSFFLASCDVSF